MNKDEADKCFALAEKYFLKGEYEKVTLENHRQTSLRPN